MLSYWTLACHKGEEASAEVVGLFILFVLFFVDE